MRFSELVTYINNVKIVNGTDADVTGITYDSRQVKPGYVFIAMEGGTFDGHGFVSKALEAGAAAIVAEHELPEVVEKGVPYVLAPNGRIAMGEISAPFFGFPARKMKLVGVTGTSGKTTVTHMINTIFSVAGKNVGLVGTLGAKIDGKPLESGEAKHTTPESVDLQETLAYMVEQGVEVAAMEVSSHGLYQGRSLGCEFDCGVFNNIARDHLDFHNTVEAYLDAKLILLREYPEMTQKPFWSVVNADDPSAAKVLDAAKGTIITFGIDAPADVKATNVNVEERSIAFDMTYKEQTVPIWMGLGGLFNVYNALSAAAASIALGLDIESVAKGLRSVQVVPGRFEPVDCGQDFHVYVDYAHTPDELESVLDTARRLAKKRLIVVFGCGGNRDTGKRPIMGEIGTRFADVPVITSDNPRKEDPDAIIEDILTGIPAEAKTKIMVEPDRREAIRKAITLAQSDDLVVIAGKGHEDYQILADRTIHFDDREVAGEILSELMKNASDKS